MNFGHCSGVVEQGFFVISVLLGVVLIVTYFRLLKLSKEQGRFASEFFLGPFKFLFSTMGLEGRAELLRKVFLVLFPGTIIIWAVGSQLGFCY